MQNDVHELIAGFCFHANYIYVCLEDCIMGAPRSTGPKNSYMYMDCEEAAAMWDCMKSILRRKGGRIY